MTDNRDQQPIYMQRLRDFNILNSKCDSLMTLPRKLRDHCDKKEQKDKTQREGISMTKQDLLVLTVQCTHALWVAETIFQLWPRSKRPRWMEEGLSTPYTCLRNYYQLIVIKMRHFVFWHVSPERFPVSIGSPIRMHMHVTIRDLSGYPI